MPAESGHGDTGYSRRDQEADDPRQRQRPPPAAPPPVPSARRGRAICTLGRMRAPGRQRHAPRGGGLRRACGGQEQAFPARHLRRGAARQRVLAARELRRRGPCRRRAERDRRVGPEPTPAVAGAGPDAAAGANARMIDSGRQFAVGWSAPTSASRPAAVGRWLGSLARQRSISGRTSAGTWSRLGEPWTTRYSSAAVVPVPNGPWPVAAKARTAPRLKMSLGGPTSRPTACSGDMNPGEPITRPACVSAVDSTAREMPKSMTRGPSSASSTFDGLRSRCTTPAAWIALRLSARPAASVSSDPAGNGPWSSIASSQRRPGDISRGQPRRRPVDVRVHHHGREYAAHPARRGDLPPEPIPELRIRGQLSPDDLHRYRPAARGDAEENPAHAAAAKLADQPVRADRLRISRLQSRDHAAPERHLNALVAISDMTTIKTAFRELKYIDRAVLR